MHFGVESAVANNSVSLYEKVKSRLLENDWEAVKLYRCGIDSATIEDLLCDRLAKIAHKDGQPLRITIVEAMAEIGSPATLSLLDSFLYDMTPGASVHETFSESLTPLDQYKIRGRSAFLKSVERAIEQIREREISEAALDQKGAPGEEIPTPEPSQRLLTSTVKEKAEKCIAIGLPDIALFVIRRGAEDIAKQAYCITNNDKDGRAARKFMLKKLLSAIKEGAIPERLMRLLHIFQTFGNLVAHPQGDEESGISDDVAQSMIVLYVYADGVFKDWLERRDDGRQRS